MKTLPAILMLLPLSAVAEVAGRYVSFVRQIQADSGVEWDASVAPGGRMVSSVGLGGEGSHFQLWSLHALTGRGFLLDEEFVSALAPRGRIEIVTGDPDGEIPRTRCDQPFQVRVHVSGLASALDSDAAAPTVVRQVHLRHEAFRNSPEASGLPVRAEATGLVSGFISRNGGLLLEFPATHLTGPDLTKMEGEERFSVSVPTGDGAAGAVLDAATLQVCPIAEATIRGIDPETTYADLPEVGIDLTGLYPASTTWVRVYAGRPNPSPGDVRVVSSSYVRIDDRMPQARSVTLDALGECCPGDGVFTIEVLHETPFGIDILKQQEFKVAKAPTVRGTILSGGG